MVTGQQPQVRRVVHTVSRRHDLAKENANFSVKIGKNWPEFATIRDNSPHFESKSDLDRIEGHRRVEVQLERAAHGVAHGGKPSARRVRETGVRKRRRRLARGRSARAGATRADDGTGEGVLRRRVGYE